MVGGLRRILLAWGRGRRRRPNQNLIGAGLVRRRGKRPGTAPAPRRLPSPAYASRGRPLQQEVGAAGQIGSGLLRGGGARTRRCCRHRRLFLARALARGRARRGATWSRARAARPACPGFCAAAYCQKQAVCVWPVGA